MKLDVLQLTKIVGDRAKESEPLFKYSTFKIGGKANLFVLANTTEELIATVDIARKSKTPYVVIGGGSNVLFNDNGFDGLVIKINSGRIKLDKDIIESDAGVALAKVLGQAISWNLGGLEWCAGIPGTIGGAVRGNAGAYGKDISSNVLYIKVLRNGKIKKLSNKNCKFSYRNSVFKEEGNNDVIISVALKLEKSDMEELKNKVKNILKERTLKFEGFSAGCVFKNIEVTQNEIGKFKMQNPDFPDQFVEYKKIPAAWLIDQCGLKGREIGGAKISENHAAIITNTGKATAENVIMLISIIKQKVRSKFNLQLMEEIEYVGF